MFTPARLSVAGVFVSMFFSVMVVERWMPLASFAEIVIAWASLPN